MYSSTDQDAELFKYTEEKGQHLYTPRTKSLVGETGAHYGLIPNDLKYRLLSIKM